MNRPSGKKPQPAAKHPHTGDQSTSLSMQIIAPKQIKIKICQNVLFIVVVIVVVVFVVVVFVVVVFIVFVFVVVFVVAVVLLLSSSSTSSLSSWMCNG